MFVREVGIYMERNYAFNKRSWANLPDGQKNSLEEYMKRRFDFDEIARDCESLKLKGGVRTIFLKSFSRHKSTLKQHFLKVGGYENMEQSRTKKPFGMSDENWNKTVDHFSTDEHRKQSAANKANRQKQKYTNHGGTSSYSSFCYKKKKNRLEAFHHANTDENGNFYSELAKQQHDNLKERFEVLSQTQTEESTTSKDVEVFESVLGRRRGHYRGIGPRPSTSTAASSNIAHEHEQGPISPALTQAQIDTLFQDPIFMARLSQFMDSKKASAHGDEDDMDAGDD
ncbi:hypothetical protein QVD17_10036 [Tagetes erecta]|uniref:Uncharacterized protein n=1 Tax=Tagetes erecta TaxID=13708 RepID=A0AAD8L0D2_TARER|nr:hypothetical protein QVD17_10036 [Tagetes erecta]